MKLPAKQLDPARHDRPVPRYTSYPTAPHFTPAVDAATYEAWLAALPPGPLSLYLHVPFCDTLCWFCGCHTTIVRRHEPVAAYVELLLREAELLAERLKGRRAVGHLHFGGGSPTILSPEEIRALGARLWGAFERAPGAEVAVEIDPRDLAAGTIEAFAEIGVNRASIGLQDVNEEVQRAINRIQPLDETAAVVERLRTSGIAGINVDLMYGLPYQTVERVIASVEAALTLAPDRLALFGYAHVPHMKRHQQLIPEAALPDGPARFAQAEAAAARLVAAGYRRIGLDHFARPDDSLTRAQEEGRLHRNFQGYTTDAAPALLGLGASAIGRLPQGFVQNVIGVPGYRRAILAGRLPVVRGVAVSDDDRRRARLIERLMCDLSVDLDAFLEGHETAGRGAEVFAGELAALAPLAADGLVEVEGACLRVSEAGRPFLRLVAAAFDAYLIQGGARHSQAV
jgi:oxygen-independent coproporphyrinogen-3 oxidase